MSKQLKVSDLMHSAVITVKQGDTIKRADLEMRFAAIRHLPVVDERYHVVGVLSQRDLMSWLASSQNHDFIVGQAMTHDVLTIRDSAPAADAVGTMLANKVGCLPVVGDHGRLVGVVTDTDYLQIAYDRLRATAADA